LIPIEPSTGQDGAATTEKKNNNSDNNDGVVVLGFGGHLVHDDFSCLK
jgi:hypothetical protein